MRTYLILIVLSFASTAFALTRISVRPAADTTPAAYQLTDWLIDLDQAYANPFDPAEIAIDAAFTSPGQKTIQLPAFWYQDFRRELRDNRERLIPVGQPHWRLRFCAPAPGKWQLVVTAKDRSTSVRSDAVSFDVAPSNDPGFIRRAPGNSRYFQFDNGQPYFIVGPNVCWADGPGLRGYEKYFTALGKAQANYARLWMTGPNVPMETKAAGIGKYDLLACWFYDQVFNLASKNNLRCMLAIHTYGDFVTGGHFGEGQWDSNPYNARNGGPATRPVDFSTSPLARQFYQRRLRYLIARYSASTCLGFWEFFNEQDLTKGAVTADWVRQMTRYLKTNDPYQHLVTTSFASPGPAEIWKIPDIDLTQRHMYGGDEPIANLPAYIEKSTRSHDAYAKPHLVGVIGISWKGPDDKFDPKGIGTEFHNALWASALSGSAGGSCTWWWDSYLHPKNLYSHYTALAKFAAAVDWPRRNFAPVQLSAPAGTDLKVLALADGNDELLAWLVDPASTCTNDRAGKTPRLFEKTTLHVPALGNSRYEFQWWDTRAGQVVGTGGFSTRDASVDLPIPPFRRDIALRLTRMNK